MGNCLGILRNSRDSFSHRICDDLCEVILQYLSLEDKFRFESVSHQFQRTIFQRQNELRLYFYNPAKILLELNHFKSYEPMVKKCANITSVYISDFYLWEELKALIQLIAKNCAHVTKFKFNSPDFAVLDMIAGIFGPRLQCFECVRFQFPLAFLKQFPNIQQLNLRIVSCEYNSVQDLFFPELRKLKAEFNNQNVYSLLNFIRNNPGIKCLSLTSDIYFSEEKNILLLEVSNLKKFNPFSCN